MHIRFLINGLIEIFTKIFNFSLHLNHDFSHSIYALNLVCALF